MAGRRTGREETPADLGGRRRPGRDEDGADLDLECKVQTAGREEMARGGRTRAMRRGGARRPSVRRWL